MNSKLWNVNGENTPDTYSDFCLWLCARACVYVGMRARVYVGMRALMYVGMRVLRMCAHI